MAESLFSKGVKSESQQADFVIRLAQCFADSGRFCNWLDIEWALADQGYGARTILDYPEIRNDLDERCAAAITKRKAESEEMGYLYQEPCTPCRYHEPLSDSTGAWRNWILAEAEKS